MPELVDESYPPKEPRIEESSYRLSINEARVLLQEPKETLSVGQRREEIDNLLDLASKVEKKDLEGQQEIVEGMSRLLQSDPLSDQQAGAVARYIHYAAGKHETFNTHGLSLSQEEAREIEAGDWPKIDGILSSSPERKKAWLESKSSIHQNNKPITLFRGMYLGAQEVELIRKYGIVPEGLRRYKTLEPLLAAGLLANAEGEDPTFGYLKLLEQRLPISKVNVLLGLWQMGGLGMVNPRKLAISATSLENAERQRGRFWGDHMVEIYLPASRVIKGPDTSDKIHREDELSILYYIDPKSIVGIYDQSGPNYQTHMEDRFLNLKRRDKVLRLLRR